MQTVPASILNILKEVPERRLYTVCEKLKITETDEYKTFVKTNSPSKSPCKTFLEVQLTSGNKITLSNIYHSIEGFLFLGGCAPGIGIAFNLIDACFCYALGNYFGCFVAIISCFPIPGFKVAEKGLEKLLARLLKKISPDVIFKRFYKELHKHLINYLGTGEHIGITYAKSLGIIREKLEEMIVGLYNPFATEIICALGKTIKRLPQITPKSSKGITTYNISLLEITDHKISLLGITAKGLE